MNELKIVGTTKQAIAERLKQARLDAGFAKITDATRAFHWNYSAYRAHETGQNGIKPAEIEEYAKAFGTTASLLQFGPEGAHISRELAAAGAFPPVTIPGRELVGANDLPIFAATQGGDGHMIVSTDIVETRKRPSILEGVPNAYGLLVVGDSMAKVFRHGDLALVHPGLPMARDDVHVFYDHPQFGQAGEATSIIKNLINWTDKDYILEQFNPFREWKVPRVDWPVCHRVVGKYSAR